MAILNITTNKRGVAHVQFDSAKIQSKTDLKTAINWYLAPDYLKQYRFMACTALYY